MVVQIRLQLCELEQSLSDARCILRVQGVKKASYFSRNLNLYSDGCIFVYISICRLEGGVPVGVCRRDAPFGLLNTNLGFEILAQFKSVLVVTIGCG